MSTEGQKRQWILPARSSAKGVSSSSSETGSVSPITMVDELTHSTFASATFKFNFSRSIS